MEAGYALEVWAPLDPRRRPVAALGVATGTHGEQAGRDAHSRHGAPRASAVTRMKIPGTRRTVIGCAGRFAARRRSDMQRPFVIGGLNLALAASASICAAASNLNSSKSNAYRAVYSPAVTAAQAIAVSDPGLPAEKPAKGKATK